MTDFWTSCQNRSYGALTVHYVDSDYSWRQKNLQKEKESSVLQALCLRFFLHTKHHNIWQHLREAHPSEYHEAKLPGESSLKSTDSMVTEPEKPTDTSSSSISNKQIQITGDEILFEKVHTFCNKIINSICYGFPSL